MDRAISSALAQSKPAYIEVCCNLPGLVAPCFTDPPVPYVLARRHTNETSLRAAVAECASHLSGAGGWCRRCCCVAAGRLLPAAAMQSMLMGGAASACVSLQHGRRPRHGRCMWPGPARHGCGSGVVGGGCGLRGHHAALLLQLARSRLHPPGCIWTCRSTTGAAVSCRWAPPKLLPAFRMAQPMPATPPPASPRSQARHRAGAALPPACRAAGAGGAGRAQRLLRGGAARRQGPLPRGPRALHRWAAPAAAAGAAGH